MSTLRFFSALRWQLAGRPWLIIVSATAAVFAVWAIGTRRQPHHVRVAFPAAVNVVKGLDVQVDGFDVGKISDVTLQDGQAIVELGISDKRFWPLRAGTVATLRWPTPAGSGTRKVDLDPAPSGPAIPEGGIITGRDVRTPVEIDQIFETFNTTTRRHLKRALAHTAQTVAPRVKVVRKALRDFNHAVTGYRDVSADLSADTQALRMLLRSGGGLATELAPREAQISNLVDVAATTLDTFAQHADDVQRTLAALPPTLTQARQTLARLDTTSGKLGALVDDLRPGAAKLDALATSARPTLTALRPTARMGAQVAHTLRQAAPPLTRTLKTATPMFDDMRSILTDATPMLECLRPYTPELAGVTVNWNSWVSKYFPVKTQAGRIRPGGQDHYARVLIVASPTSFHAYPQDTPSTTQLLLGKKYAMPRPPGLGVDKPWFLPQCGVTPDALNAAKDPEDRK
jgi:virulence factor Mce-like protein